MQPPPSLFFFLLQVSQMTTMAKAALAASVGQVCEQQGILVAPLWSAAAAAAAAGIMTAKEWTKPHGTNKESGVVHTGDCHNRRRRSTGGRQRHWSRWACRARRRTRAGCSPAAWSPACLADPFGRMRRVLCWNVVMLFCL